VAVEVEVVTAATKAVRALDDDPPTMSASAVPDSASADLAAATGVTVTDTGATTTDGATATGALVGAPTDTDTAP
jgi:hypothetical protein